MILASIPSPARGVWHLGPFPIRAYAFFIILGVVVAVYLGDRRWVARGGRHGTVADVAVWAVPFGLIGARLYHVITDPELYFGRGRSPIDAVKIWQGGLGVWGGIALGAVAAWVVCSRRGISIAAFGDAVAPGIAIAQAIGRLGNWFNQELYGRATDLPWALHITRPQDGVPGYYHPTFLYELLWDLGVAALVIWAHRRYRMGGGRVFALYVAGYTAGRLWIEALRVDQANHILGVRLNIWTSGLVFLAAVGYLVLARGRGREDSGEPPAEHRQGPASDAGATAPAG